MELATGTDVRSGWATQLCNAEALVAYWPSIVEMMRRVPQTWKYHTEESLYNSAISGNIQVWTLGPEEKVRAVVFTQVATFPAVRVLEVIWMCGEKSLDGLDVLDGTITEFARIQQCDQIDIIGRDGWRPIVKRYGFEVRGTVYSRLVPKGRLQ